MHRYFLTLLLATLTLSVASARAATLTVTSTADAGGSCPGADCTLRQALATAASGDTINFAAGLTEINLTSAQLLINKNLTISGPGANLLRVQRSTAGGTPAFRIFFIDSTATIVTLSGLTIANGNAGGDRGGGILISSGSTVTITNSTIAGNSASLGGGIFNFAGGPS